MTLQLKYGQKEHIMGQSPEHSYLRLRAVQVGRGEPKNKVLPVGMRPNQYSADDARGKC